MNKLAIGTALAVLTIAVPAAAPAQRVGAAIVAVVDTQRVLEQCTACRTASATLQQQAQQAQQREQQLGAPLQTEGQALQAAITALAGKAPDAALQKRVDAFQQKRDSAAQEMNNRRTTLQSTEANINQQIGAKLGPIFNSVMVSRGANVVMAKASTLASSPALDITADVVAQLNQQLTTISVTPLPQAQTQQQPQGR
jgi:Skp family chaperone for outer membrane proteins